MQSLANFIMNVNILLNVEKTKIKVKEAGNCPFLRTIVLLTLCLFCSSVPISFLRQKGDAKFEKKSSPSSLSDSSFLYFCSFEREKRFSGVAISLSNLNGTLCMTMRDSQSVSQCVSVPVMGIYQRKKESKGRYYVSDRETRR